LRQGVKEFGKGAWGVAQGGGGGKSKTKSLRWGKGKYLNRIKEKQMAITDGLDSLRHRRGKVKDSGLY